MARASRGRKSDRLFESRPPKYVVRPPCALLLSTGPMTVDEKAPGGESEPTPRPHSPSALVAFTACVHRSELERAAAAKLVRKPHYPSSTLDGLIQRGREHERAHLEGLRAEGLDIVEIPSADFRTP